MTGLWNYDTGKFVFRQCMMPESGWNLSTPKTDASLYAGSVCQWLITHPFEVMWLFFISTSGCNIWAGNYITVIPRKTPPDCCLTVAQGFSRVAFYFHFEMWVFFYFIYGGWLFKPWILPLCAALSLHVRHGSEPCVFSWLANVADIRESPDCSGCFLQL